MREIEVDPVAGLVFEHGWQSWSPTTTYPVTATSHRPIDADTQLCGYRPGVDLPQRGFQGEGLLAVQPAPGEPVHVFAAGATTVVPSVRAALCGPDRLRVEWDGPVEEHLFALPLDVALGQWAETFAGPRPIRRAPTVWCSWYQYHGKITESDVLENVEAIGEHALPVDVVQIDDGWQAGIGDWTTVSGRFGPLERLAARIRAAGRRPGIWLAPFLAGSDSRLAREHPDWLIPGLGNGWGQQLSGLDLGRADAQAHLTEVFQWLAVHFDYFKVDFLYAGAVPGLDHYRHGLGLIRDAIGPQAYLVGCGAPILPSVGLVDAMRVGPDIAPHYEPLVPDMCSYSQRTATLSTVGRAWQHGRFWVNDPDCLLLRPEMERREQWARTVRRYGGLRALSDRIASLDEWGLATAHSLLSEPPPEHVVGHALQLP